MKRTFMAGAGLVAVAAMLGVEPAASQVTQQVRNACEKKANLVRPALRADEREAYIANCLANATAATPKRRKQY